MQRREFITLLGGAAAAWPLTAGAQKSARRIGWLVYGGATLGPIDQSLKDALAQAGLVDGSNIEIVFRYANGISDRLAELAAELVAQKPDLLLAVGGDVIKPLFEASKGSIYRNLASSLSGAGRIAEAKQAFAEVMLRYPDLTVSKFRQAMVVSPATMNRMAENLRKLGLPD
jgi:hypothetical protein